MNFILDPYILAVPQSPVDPQRIEEYAENLYLWVTEAVNHEHKFWLSGIIVNTLLNEGLYPSYDNLRRLQQNAPSILVFDAITLFRAAERGLMEPPLLDELIDDSGILVESEHALVIPVAIEQRLPEPVGQALRKTLILSAYAARCTTNDVFFDLLFATAKNGFRDADLRVEFDALIPLLESIETVTKEWPIVTSPNQLSDVGGLAAFWENTEKALRWVYDDIFAADTSPPPYPVVTTHSGFNKTVRDCHCHKRPATLLKIFRTTVLGLTGTLPRNTETHHPLTKGGKQIVSGQATAWRLWIEHASPGWRLHYWKFPDGSIELANLVTHDSLFIPTPNSRLQA